MSKFAKLFELSDGGQVLFLIKLNNENIPVLEISTEIDDVRHSVSLESKCGFDTPKEKHDTWAEIENLLRVAGDRAAIVFRKTVIDKLDPCLNNIGVKIDNLGILGWAKS